MLETPTDDPVIAQLRAWADDLADRVPATPAPTAERGGRRRRRPTVLALAAAVLVVLALVGVAVGLGRDDGEDVHVATTTVPSTSAPTSAPSTTGTTTPAVADRPLEGPTWWLEGLSVDGEAYEIPLDVVVRIGIGPSECPPGPDCLPPAGTTVLGGYDGCNGFSAQVTVGDGTIVGHGIGGTLVGCTGARDEISSLVRLGAGDARYAISGDVLTLTAGGVEATYRAGTDDGYPAVPADGGIIGQAGGEAPYRAWWEPIEVASEHGVRVRVMQQGTTPPSAGGIDMVGPTRVPFAAAVATGGPQSVLAGVVDARATLVTYRWGGTVVEVPTVPLPGAPGLRGFTALVDGSTMGWRLWATAADGSEVATFVHRP